MIDLKKSKANRIAYFISILDRGGTINKDKAMTICSVDQKTIERNMFDVMDIMRELYGKKVIWDGKKKAYRVEIV